MFKTLVKIICVVTICLFITNCTSAENSTPSSNQNTSMQTTQTTKNSIDLSSYFENIIRLYFIHLIQIHIIFSMMN